MKNLLLIMLFTFAVNVNAAVINETTNPYLDTTFLNAGASNLDTNSDPDLYWLKFGSLVLGHQTLGYSVDNNVGYYGPYDWRLPTQSEAYSLFDTFFTDFGFVDSGDGTMTIGEGDGQDLLIQSRNSWMLGFGSDIEPTVGSSDPNDAILHSIGLYVDSFGAIQKMGIEFDMLNLSTTIFGKGYSSTGLQANVAYEDYGVFMVHDVPAVPVPAAVWLFGSGLIGLVAVARRKA